MLWFNCVVPKNTHLPPPPPPPFHTEGTFVFSPQPPGISVIFLERIFPSNMLLHYTFIRKVIASAIKREKIFSFMLRRCQISAKY